MANNTDQGNFPFRMKKETFLKYVVHFSAFNQPMAGFKFFSTFNLFVFIPAFDSTEQESNHLRQQPKRTKLPSDRSYRCMYSKEFVKIVVLKVSTSGPFRSGFFGFAFVK